MICEFLHTENYLAHFCEFIEKLHVCDFKPEIHTFCFQHGHEVHSTGDYQSVNFKKFPDFSGQFSKFLTFPGFPGSLTTLIHGFTVMEH